MDQFNQLARILAAAGVERPWRELRLLVAHAAGQEYVDTLCSQDMASLVDEFGKETLTALVFRRANHEPITKIIEKASFWKYVFRTTHDTLDPRPESEFLVETVLELYSNKRAPLTFLDLGTGTGCLLLSCLTEYPMATGVGVDISIPALEVAKNNAQSMNLSNRARFACSDWNREISGVFDVILCNPPYVSESEPLEQNGGRLAPEAMFDPPMALFAGKDGLDAYRAIFSGLQKNIVIAGTRAPSTVLFEIGSGMHDPVLQIAQTHGFRLVKTVKDYQDIYRVLVFYYD
jgi:release factor glutamine methyltransferase